MLLLGMNEDAGKRGGGAWLLHSKSGDPETLSIHLCVGSLL